MNLESKLRGIMQGPTGSEARKFPHNIDNADPHAMYSAPGQTAIRAITKAYRDSGANIGITASFRLTDQRIAGSQQDQDWDPKAAKRLHLDPRFSEYNGAAVRIAREVYGSEVAVGVFIAPITDTSGEDDKRVLSLGDQYQELAYLRQRPQVAALAGGGADILWAEAIRYQQEAMALARLAREFGMKALMVSFEATHKGFPDPSANDTYGFNEMETDMQHEAGGDRIIHVGVNCTGITNMNLILDSGIVPGAMYANGDDFGAHNGTEKTGLWRLAENRRRSDVQEARFQELQTQLTTSREQFIKFWRRCRELGVPMFGVCCGGTPELVKAASDVWTEKA